MSRELLRIGVCLCLALNLLPVPAKADPPLQAPVPVTIVGSVGVDGSGMIEAAGAPQLMFNGKTPPHGFQICASPAPIDSFSSAMLALTLATQFRGRLSTQSSRSLASTATAARAPQPTFDRLGRRLQP